MPVFDTRLLIMAAFGWLTELNLSLNIYLEITMNECNSSNTKLSELSVGLV